MSGEFSQYEIIVACIDNRGTEGRGADFKKYVYKKLGQLDVQDQIKAAKYLSNFDYIDAERIGMYGWSYGGYMSPMCLMQGNDIFKLAVSVGPVTDWRYYDTIYTERYMQTPILNKKGYELGSILNYVNLLKGKLLIIHGMADDNVHFQNSAELVKVLIRNNKQFDTMFYPGYKHGISGKKEHVFTKITNFILENL
jgi:dipeptidyl-peptidase-4